MRRYGQLIDAVYNADRELATTTVLRECSSGSAWSVAVATTLTADPLLRTELLLATMLASWCDRYADVFLSIGGARLSVRLQRQVFNLIMEQDAAFFGRMKTGSCTQASLLASSARLDALLMMPRCSDDDPQHERRLDPERARAPDR